MNRTFFRTLITTGLAVALMVAPMTAMSQVRRGGGNTGNKETTTRSSGSQQVNRSGSSSQQVNRSSQQASRSGSSSSSQVNRSSRSNSSASQVNRSGSSSSSQVKRSSRSNSSASQVNRSSGSQQVNRSGSSSSSQVKRSSGSTSSKSNSSREATTVRRSSGDSPQTGNRTSSTSRSSLQVVEHDTPQVERSGSIARTNRSVTSKGLGSYDNSSRPSGPDHNNRVNQPPAINAPWDSHMRLDGHRDLHRVPPRERDFMPFDRPGHYYDRGYHYFGYRVRTLPPTYRQMTYWGRKYYFYNDVFYRRYGDWYAVCRPPFGVCFDVSLPDVAFASVRFAYYQDVYLNMRAADANYRTIMEQNRIIAENNARIAKQYSSLALNRSRAMSAYDIAEALGLCQSYAGLDTDYYYDDGVFYVINRRGQYEVIVPPAGALVDELPDDYDIIVLSGVEYYRVDDTVYRLTLVDGSPYLEVLGQIPSSKYNGYYY